MPIKTSYDDMPTMNLTSLIDVMFLLVLFFMVATEFTNMERDLSLTVPEVTDHGALSAAPEKKVINVHADGHLTLDRETLSIEQLTERLRAARAEYPALGVLVRGDASTAFQRVAEALNACKQAGISELGIAVQANLVAQTPRSTQ